MVKPRDEGALIMIAASLLNGLLEWRHGEESAGTLHDTGSIDEQAADSNSSARSEEYFVERSYTLASIQYGLQCACIRAASDGLRVCGWSRYKIHGTRVPQPEWNRDMHELNQRGSCSSMIDGVHPGGIPHVLHPCS